MRTQQARLSATMRERIVAFAVDYVVIAAYLVVMILVGTLMQRFFPAVNSTLFRTPLTSQIVVFCFLTLPVILYFTFTESSAAQGSLGKSRVGLMVTTVDGERIGFGKALLRNLIKFIPWELAHTCIWQMSAADDPGAPVYTIGLILVWLLVGAYIAVAVKDPDLRAPYDRVAGTVVVRQRTRRRA